MWWPKGLKKIKEKIDDMSAEIGMQPISRLGLFFRNFPMLVSALACLALFCSDDNQYLTFLLLSVLLLIFSLRLDGVYDFWKQHVTKSHVIFACMILAVQMLGLYIRMKSFLSRFNETYIDCEIVSAAVSLVVAMVGIFFLSSLFAYVSAQSQERNERGERTITDEKWRRRVELLLRLAIAGCCLSLVFSAFNYSMWLDPVYSLLIIDLPYPDFARALIADVHPPLYYVILKIAEDIFSLFSTDLLFKITVGKWVSLLAYFLTACLCWKKISGSGQPFVREMTVLGFFITSQLLNYGTEIRMYSWALFFISGTYLYSCDIMQGRSGFRNWLLLTLFSLCSAYTHNFALIAAALVWGWLLLWILKHNHQLFKRWMTWGTVAALGYMPWLFVLCMQTSTIAGNYWISEYEFSDVYAFFRGLTPGFLLLTIALVPFLVKKSKDNSGFYWGNITGILIPYTLLILTLVISFLCFPIVQSRYLLPTFFCLWIGMSSLLCRMKGALLVVMLISLVSIAGDACYRHIRKDCVNSQKMLHLLDVLRSMEDECTIYIDSSGEANPVPLQYYTENQVIAAGEKPESVFFSLLGTNLIYSTASAKSLIMSELDAGKSVYYLANQTSPLLEVKNAKYTKVSEVQLRNKFNVYKIQRED